MILVYVYECVCVVVALFVLFCVDLLCVVVCDLLCVVVCVGSVCCVFIFDFVFVVCLF